MLLESRPRLIRGKVGHPGVLAKGGENCIFFCQQQDIENQSHISVIPTTPKQCAGQQVVDYFLWALQRFYERGETRYIRLLWDSVSVVHDLDDTRQAAYGVYYTRKKPLTLAALEGRPGI